MSADSAAMAQKKLNDELFLAAGLEDENLAAVEEALAAGAEVNAQDSNGYTALMNATYARHASVVDFLLKYGAESKIKDPHGWSAMIWAVLLRDISLPDLLLKSGAEVDSKTNDEVTALMFAAREGNEKTVDLLLEHGANPCLVNLWGRKAYDMAAESGHEALAESLRAAEGQYSRWEGSDAKRAWIVAALFSKPSASCLAVGGASAAPAPV